MNQKAFYYLGGCIAGSRPPVEKDRRIEFVGMLGMNVCAKIIGGIELETSIVSGTASRVHTPALLDEAKT